MSTGENRREAFRVEDLIGLEVRALAADELEEVHASFEANRLKHGLRNHIGHHRDSQRALLKKIGARNRDIATYLSHLEDQLSRLADQISLSSSGYDREDEAPSPVSLSATGLGFDTGITLNQGEFVELVMRLMPGSQVVYVIAEVVRISENADGLYRASVRFERLHMEDEDVLTRHIVKVQQRELQSRRQAS